MKPLTCALLLCVALLPGCKVDIQGELYAQDLLAQQVLEFPAQMSFEVPSCRSEQRPQYERQMLLLYAESSRARVAGCREMGMDSMVVVDFRGEIASRDSDADLVVLREALDTGQTVLRLRMHPRFIARVESLQKSNHQRLRPERLTVGFDLHNDHPTPVVLNVRDVWVNGKPTQAAKLELQRRDKVTLGMSNVFSSLIVNGGAPFIGMISP
jgi:hypothetical protein